MFLQNKYTKWYFMLINHGMSRKKPDGYTEKHHIIPRALGGTNKHDNLVLLTAREHFIAHLLLPKMIDDKYFKNKMVWALHMMCVSAEYNFKRYKPTARMFQKIKEYKATIPRPPMSDEQKKKLSIARTGYKHADTTPFKKTDEQKRKLSLARKGKTFDYRHSDETKEKMSAWQKDVPKEKILCVHCNRYFINMNYKEWHGDNCKSKEKLEYWREYGEKFGYELLSDQYTTDKKPLLWKTPEGKIIKRTADLIKKHDFNIDENQAKSKEDHYNELKKIAEDRGGKLISKEYVNASTKLVFEDVSGNRFECLPSTIKSGIWSRYEMHLGGAKRKQHGNFIIVTMPSGKIIKYEIIGKLTKLVEIS